MSPSSGIAYTALIQRGCIEVLGADRRTQVTLALGGIRYLSPSIYGYLSVGGQSVISLMNLAVEYVGVERPPFDGAG